MVRGGRKEDPWGRAMDEATLFSMGLDWGLELGVATMMAVLLVLL